MSIFRVTVTALALASFMSATAVAAQDGRPRSKATHHVKKRTPPPSQVRTTAPRSNESWMDRGSASGGGGGGGGY